MRVNWDERLRVKGWMVIYAGISKWYRRAGDQRHYTLRQAMAKSGLIGRPAV